MEGDLYRIGTPYDDTGYYGMMYVSKDKKKAVLFTYCIRYQSRTLIPKFRLHGLDAKTRYTVREQNTDKKRFWFDGGTFTGEYLANAGINPNLSKIYDSRIRARSTIAASFDRPGTVPKAANEAGTGQRTGQERPLPERLPAGAFFRLPTSGTQRPVYSTATPRANVRNASNSAGEIASG